MSLGRHWSTRRGESLRRANDGLLAQEFPIIYGCSENRGTTFAQASIQCADSASASGAAAPLLRPDSFFETCTLESDRLTINCLLLAVIWQSAPQVKLDTRCQFFRHC